ncbi:MAG: hypothetical protein ACI8X3_003201 [Saprospiraceae bacterium]|jgi:hypothetical protein
MSCPDKKSKTMKNSIWLILMFSLFIFWGCEKEELLPKVDENGLTPDINSLVSANNLDALTNIGLVVNGGATPPILNGEYVISTCVITQSTAGDFPGTLVPDFFIKLYDQNDLQITVDYRHGSQVGEAIGSYIVGEDCSFSVFIEVNEINLPTDAEARLLLAVSGKLVNNGIEEIQVANLMLDNFGNANGIWINNGTGRLFEDQDDFSEIVGGESKWYTKLPDCPCEYTDDINGKKEMCGEWSDCDSSSKLQEYHYGASYEIRWIPDQANQPGQQCTYDINKKLITAGIAAGSPDKDSPDICGWGDILTGQGFPDYDHYCKDVVPWGKGGSIICSEISIPCWQYFQEWPANNGNGCPTNEVSGIQHMLKLVGDMSCEEATLLIKSAKESLPLFIDSALKDYLAGDNLSLTDPQLIVKLENWKSLKSCNLFPNDDLCMAIDLAISNLQ